MTWEDYGARMYDPQIGRWMVVDPAASNFYSETSYCYAGNDPIMHIDVGGQFKFRPDDAAYIKKNYPVFYKFITSPKGAEAFAKNEHITSAYLKNTISTNSAEVANDFVYRNGPVISLRNDNVKGGQINVGEFSINKKLLAFIERVKGPDQEAAFAFAMWTLLHEEAHHRNLVEGAKGKDINFSDSPNRKNPEDGDALINDLYFGGSGLDEESNKNYVDFSNLRLDDKEFDKKAIQIGKKVIKAKESKNEGGDIPGLQRFIDAGIKVTFN